MSELQTKEEKLLLAIVQQAYRDLLADDAGYKREGMDCTCRIHEENHHVKGKCAGEKPYEIMPARKWIEECSMDEWGFGWVCVKLGREPEIAKVGILKSAETDRNSDKLSRMNRIG